MVVEPGRPWGGRFITGVVPCFIRLVPRTPTFYYGINVPVNYFNMVFNCVGMGCCVICRSTRFLAASRHHYSVRIRNSMVSVKMCGPTCLYWGAMQRLLVYIIVCHRSGSLAAKCCPHHLLSRVFLAGNMNAAALTFYSIVFALQPLLHPSRLGSSLSPRRYT
jgi:hypothetical protein